MLKTKTGRETNEQACTKDGDLKPKKIRGLKKKRKRMKVSYDTIETESDKQEMDGQIRGV